MMHYQEKLVEEPSENTLHDDLSEDEENNLSSIAPKTNKRAEEEDQQRRDVLTRLRYSAILCGIFFCVEVTGGILSGSLSILSDAAHLFADLASFIIAILASHLASRPPCEHYTYGYKRVEALAALFSVGSLALVSIFLFGEAIVRLWLLGTRMNVEPVNGKIMSFIAFFGVIVNIILAIILGEDHVHLPGMTHDHDHDHDHDHKMHDDHDDHDHHHKHEDSQDHGHNHKKHDNDNDDHDHHHKHDDAHDHGHNHKKHDNDDHDHHHKHDDVHDHEHSHVHGEDCEDCGPNSHVTSEIEVDDTPIPDWKKKALEQNLDPTAAPFGGSWNMESVYSVPHTHKNEDEDKNDDYNEHAHDHEHKIEHKREHEHEHEHDHHEHHQKHEKHLDHVHDHDHNAVETTALLSSKHNDYHHDCDDHHHIEAKPVTNINLSAAYLHVLGDLAMSVAVLLSGVTIWINPKLQAIDPLCTIFFCIWVFKSTLSVIQSSMSILMEVVPSHLNYETIFAALSSVKGVCDVHDLHIWSISHGVPAVSAHVLVCNNDGSKDTRNVLQDIHEICISKFGIFHNTIQIQIVNDRFSRDCITCKDGTMTH